MQVANVDDPGRKDRAHRQYSQVREINGKQEAALVQSGSGDQCRSDGTTGRDRCGDAERGRGIRRRRRAIPAFFVYFGAALYHRLVRRNGVLGSMATW